MGAPPSHAEKAVGVGGKSGAKWRNQSDQLRIAMSASKGGPQVTHPADNASLLTNTVCHAWLVIVHAQHCSVTACPESPTASTTRHSSPPQQPPQKGTHTPTPQQPPQQGTHTPTALTPQQHSHPKSTHTPIASTTWHSQPQQPSQRGAAQMPQGIHVPV